MRYCITYYTDVQTKEFTSWVSFLSWKEEEESQTYACFVQINGEVLGSEGKISGWDL